ncbi:VOC family protein [Pseudomonas sp. OIL-1]|nr:VOC family protein [Pseudomonas sp. OIL-1]
MRKKTGPRVPRHHPVRQIAYFVDDVARSAYDHHLLFGSGPYFVVENIELAVCLHRGEPSKLDHTSAYGQWGEVMVEFCQQNNPGPSVFYDHCPIGNGAIHHVAIMVEDLQLAISGYEQAGYETALYAELTSGQAYAMIDCTRALGHFVELYEPTEELTDFYSLVRSASQDWDGNEV